MQSVATVRVHYNESTWNGGWPTVSDRIKCYGCNVLMKLYRCCWRLLHLLPLLHRFRVCVLGLLSNFRPEFLALKKPKHLANLGPNLYRNRFFHNSARLVIFGGVIIFLAGNCVPTEVFVFNTHFPVQLEVLMERRKLSRSSLNVGGKDGSEHIFRCHSFCDLRVLVLAPIPLTKLLCIKLEYSEVCMLLGTYSLQLCE